MIKGVIFDYNRTLFFDMDIAEYAYRKVYEKAGCDEEYFEDYYQAICRSGNTVSIKLLSEFAGRDFTEEEAKGYSDMIDEMYQQGCIWLHRDQLAEGAEDLFAYLRDKGYRMTICTATVGSGVDFYFRNTRLDRWFDRKLVSHDDGVCVNKKEMYKKAAENIGLRPEECLIFEDSIKGIEDAMSVGFDKFIYVNHYHFPSSGYRQILQEIENYKDLDYSIFEKN
ncbi:MAG: HAD family phosphatase [Erysipelotrichaceae bacterium]|nr:HAD family phosphatase [Erysipelotrichaceae bacterium]